MIARVQLHEVATVNMGTAPPGDTYNDRGEGVPMIAGAGDYGDIYPQTKKWTTAPTRVARNGDLIICVRATIGDLNWADRDYCLGRGVAGIRADEDKLDIRYLARYIDSKKAELSKLGTGSTFLAIRRADLEEFPVPLPPLPEQRRIAAILDKADAIRRKRQRAIELCEDFLRSAFLEMFGDPVTNPKGWDVFQLEELLKTPPQNGAYFPKSDYLPNDDNAGVEMVHMSDAFYGIVERGKLKRVRASRADIKKYVLSDSDLLVARRSLNYEGSVKPCRIQKNSEPLIFESSLIRISADQRKILPIYLYFYLSDARARQHYVFPHVTKSTISGINQAGLKRIQVITPPLHKQSRFQSLFWDVEKKIKSKALFLDISDKLVDSLTHRAFRGELTPTATEEIFKEAVAK